MDTIISMFEKDLQEACKDSFGVECSIQFMDVQKNNGISHRAVIIKEPGYSTFPMIYTDEMLSQIASGKKSSRETACDVIRIYQEHKDSALTGIDLCSLTKESMLSKVFCQLINADKNRSQLLGIPSKEFLDLAVVYRFPVLTNEEGIASILVNNSMLQGYDISPEELHSAAMENTCLQEFHTIPMDDVIAEFIKDDIESDNGNIMWVLTNTKRLYGAAVLLHLEHLSKLADKLKDDLYVLPSSIHEVIAVPVSILDVKELKNMVYSANTTYVAEEDALGCNVYLYSRKDNTITIA